MKKKTKIFILVIILIILIILGVIFFTRDSESEQNNEIVSDDLLIEETANTKETLPDIDIITGENTSVSMTYIKNKGLPIILCFVADWCEPCQEFEPILEELEGEYNGKVVIQLVDKDLNEELADYYDVQKVPTQVFINSDQTAYIHDQESDDFEQELDDEGNIIYTKHIGTFTKAELTDIIDKMD